MSSSSTVNRVVTKLMRIRSRDAEIPSFKRGANGEIKEVNLRSKKNTPAIDRAELLDPEDMAW
ncbi:hypothetical protein M422DRAFT_253221 [Sphaerobolus stellatus SS14]|uniref:Uncharacterized protein n=1 Tax=Sphaerobolus stellatus (strain SS14) TaxID=990650 RepID=A0A0C9VXK6_SPHS4|nr:hypothetical protein M422DRAFT_253221 [Sphaerobolus stellatus SS14]